MPYTVEGLIFYLRDGGEHFLASGGYFDSQGTLLSHDGVIKYNLQLESVAGVKSASIKFLEHIPKALLVDLATANYRIIHIDADFTTVDEANLRSAPSNVPDCNIRDHGGLQKP